MTDNDIPYQPGSILYGAILGAFRARGWSFEGWLTENGIAQSTARNATYGQSSGPVGRALLARLIEAAGPDVVRAGYIAQMHRNLEAVRRAQPRMTAEAAAEIDTRRRQVRASS